MTLILAATSPNTPEMPEVWLVGIVLFVAVGYAAACYIRPFTHCHRCDGTGASARRATDRIRYGTRPGPRAARGLPACPHCRGTGLRLRIGRRLFNRLARLHRDAHR